MSTHEWQPGCSLETLRLNAAVLRDIRGFFDDSGALEVMTPVLSTAAIPDPHVRSLVCTDDLGTESSLRYLQTSPEFAMKRLLAAGSGDIYQIAPVFRSGEAGHRHNPEFRMLEWYRLGLDHAALMQEVEALLKRLFTSYGQSLQDSRIVTVDETLPAATNRSLEALTVPALKASLAEHGVGLPDIDDTDLESWLDLYLSTCVFPSFPTDRLTFLTDYPETQAALARLHRRPDGRLRASRFEVFLGELELGNGFHELTDAAEQRNRFEQDLRRRTRLQLPLVPIDERLLMALESGLPDCAGVALGLDRVIMCIAALENISQAQVFSDDRA